jgi:hypothetical protein
MVYWQSTVAGRSTGRIGRSDAGAALGRAHAIACRQTNRFTKFEPTVDFTDD